MFLNLKNCLKTDLFNFNDKQKIIESYVSSETDNAAKYISIANEANEEIRSEARILIDKASESQDIKET